ncbi:MAG TPA: hypothetical protein VK459_23695, partial [Polyangiaceae bacterium]|nr:hypothetical protein [Polyangiaceae bacterium]
MIPFGLSSHNLLVIVDFSWWLNKAYYAVGGVNGMETKAISWFANLLRGEAPDYLAVAVDSVGRTWRHDLTDGLPDEQHYKGHRDPKPPEFYVISNRILDIV